MTGELATVQKTPLEFLNSSNFLQSQKSHHILSKSDLKQYQFENVIPTVIKSNLSLLEFDDERTYDDPCDLMEEWSSTPTHIPRSRSWLCCPNTLNRNNSIPKRQRRISCEYSTLVTEAPKLKEQNNVFFFELFFFWCRIIFICFLFYFSSKMLLYLHSRLRWKKYLHG